ncbi:AraC family transcriptional regulator [Bacillus solitudinis]|uniref:AraC family transcriptional regulator n=1 Tax=Bacillus solitudinis TaxID=2014074 RepID=UPI000C24CF8D|nr:AraC family transcriptional regulator [Bacillus solitudinis]
MSIPSITSAQINLSYYQRYKTEMNFHSHEEYEIYYFHGGKCNYLIGDQIHVLSPGDLILMNGLTLHCPKIFEHEEYIRTTLHFDHVHFRGILRHMGMESLLNPFFSLQSFRIPFRDNEKEEVEKLFSSMHQFSNKKGVVSEYRFQLAFLDMLAYLYPFCQRSLTYTKDPQSEKEKNVQQVITYLEKHFKEDVNLKQLGEDLHLSKYYLAKIFKDVTGVTIFNYLYHRRINQAKIEFLMNDELTVTELSYMVGFKHPSHFSKVFKDSTGVTPEYYKKRMISQEKNRQNS